MVFWISFWYFFDFLDLYESPSLISKVFFASTELWYSFGYFLGFIERCKYLWICQSDSLSEGLFISIYKVYVDRVSFVRIYKGYLDLQVYSLCSDGFFFNL